MGASQNDVNYMGATTIPLVPLGSATFPTKIIPPPYCVGLQFKIIAAGAAATVMILPNAIAGGSVGGATQIINGYPLITGEMYPIPGPAAFWLATAGSTALVAFNFMFSAGKGLDGNA